MSVRRALLRVVGYGVAGIAILLLGAGLYFLFVRWDVANTLAIDTSAGIDTLESPLINGTAQWVQIRGQRRDNPAILFIHGGPGMPMMPLAHAFQPSWEEQFTVAQWDQRFAGLSRVSPRIADGKVIDTYVQDAYEVAQYVARKTGQRKIAVVAHSWGSVIGLKLVRKHPQLFYAYVGTGQVLNLAESDRRGFEWALSRARAEGKAQAIAELEALEPYADSAYQRDGRTQIDQLLKAVGTQRKWVDAFGGSSVDKQQFDDFMRKQFTSPAYSLRDLYRLVNRTSDEVLGGVPTMLDEFLHVDLVSEGLRFHVPIFFFEGRYDYTAAASVVEKYFPRIEAPHKELLWFEKSAHWPMTEEPERFAKLLIERVRPFARPVPVDSLESPLIGRVPQWVQIRGRDRTNPPLLVVHGGPGVPLMPLTSLFQRGWENYFTVVHWDQRGVGKSWQADPNGVPSHGAIAAYVQDAYEVAKYVSEATGHERIGVVGHGWGSIIGLELVRAHPQLFYAYVGVGQVLDATEQERRAYVFAVDKARATSNTQALSALRAIAPYPQSIFSARSVEEQRDIFLTTIKWNMFFGGDFVRRPPHSVFDAAARSSDAYTAEDLANWRKPKRPSILAGTTLLERLQYRFEPRAEPVAVPVLFFEGRHDHEISSQVVAERYAAVNAKHKELHWFESSAHFPMFEEPERFLELLIQHVRPLAQ